MSDRERTLTAWGLAGLLVVVAMGAFSWQQSATSVNTPCTMQKEPTPNSDQVWANVECNGATYENRSAAFILAYKAKQKPWPFTCTVHQHSGVADECKLTNP